MEPTLKACLNGDRLRTDHPAVPVTPEELATAAYDAAAAPGSDGVAAAQAILAELPDTFELVVHGENEWAWPVLEWARANGYGLRAGLEDMLTGPTGETVADNAELVALMRGKL